MRVLAPAILLVIASATQAEDLPARIRASIERGLPLVQNAARRYPENRECFSCHHQTLPMLAMRTAREAGVEIDRELLDSQLAFTRESLQTRVEPLKEGKNIGGRAMTVSYALWTWQIADGRADDVTAAMVTYLLKTQESNGSWRPPSNRPPLEESSVTCAVLSAWMLDYYAPTDDRKPVDLALARARTWLKTAERKHHEDRVFALWGAALLKEPEDIRSALRQELLTAQRANGSWSQEPEMDGDAYATGQAVFALVETGLSPQGPAIVRAAEFLIKSQEADGSWHVKTRSKPIQVYFDNGDPHGKDQFISTPASAWALTALSRLCRSE